MEYLFEARNIVKQYAAHRALDDVSIAVPKGSIFGLLGPNGAGKTSLIRIINQITAPDQGELIFDGEKLQPHHIEHIGYLPEERGLYKKMEVGEQAMYLARLKGLSKSEAKAALKKWFKTFEIEGWWNRKVEELSKGMAQKVQFIVTILHKPKLLIFDEPFSGFDPINTNLIKAEIKKLQEDGATIIFSTHRMESVEELCDHIALINNSKKVLSGEVNAIRNQFKQNLFKIDFANQVNGFEMPEGFLEKSRTNHSVQVQIPEGVSPNKILSLALKAGDVTGFNEILPSVNDIFIQAVEQKKNS